MIIKVDGRDIFANTGGRAIDPAEPVAIVCDATLPGMAVLESTLAHAAEDAARAGIQPQTTAPST